MKMFLKTVLLFIGILFFTGGACPSKETTPSNKVAQTEIYQSYSVTQNGNEYDVTAYFRIGGRTGTTLALVKPSSVTFNGETMRENLNTSSGTYYSASVPVSTATGTFVFTDRNGKTYTNKLELSTAALNSPKLSTNGTTPVSIPLSRVPPESASFSLELNHKLIFVDAARGEASEAFYDQEKNSIVILPAAWKDVENGNVAIDLEVRNSIPTQQGTALGGEMAFAYDSAPVEAAYVKGKIKTSKTAASANTSAAARPRSKKL